ncbi:putative reverse transcriptase domain-containing protein [Tanacetum coccineum]
MEPKRRATTTTTTTPITNAQLKALIDQGVADALAARDADRSRNGDDSHNSETGSRRTERTARECTYTDFLKCQPMNFKVENQVKFATCTLHGVPLTWCKSHVKTVGQNATHSMPWNTLIKMMTAKYCPRNEIKKLEMEIWELKVKGTGLASYTQRFQELALMCGRMFPEKSDKIEKSPVNANTANNQRGTRAGQKATCFECGAQGHLKRKCPKLKNNNRGNPVRNGNAPAKVYVVGNAGTNPDSNIVTEVHAKRMSHVTTKKTKDKSDGKRLKDVPIVRDFPEVFLKDLPGIVELTPGAFRQRLHKAKFLTLGSSSLVITSFEYVKKIFRTRNSELDTDIMSSKNKKEHKKHLKAILELLKKEMLNSLNLNFGFPRFIKGFSKIANSMTKLTQKGDKFYWGEKEEAAFQLIKQKLCSVPILAQPEGSETLWSIMMLRIEYYLYGTKCIVFTDHKSLQHILDQKELNMRQCYWLELLSDYDYEIHYYPRKANIVADGLSRKERNKTLRVRALVMTIGLNLPKHMLEAQIEAHKPENLKNKDVRGTNIVKISRKWSKLDNHGHGNGIKCAKAGRMLSKDNKSRENAIKG